MNKPVEIKRLLALAVPHWKTLLAATVALFVGAGLSLVYPKAAGVTMDQLIDGTTDFDFRMLGGIVLVLFFIQSIATSLRYYLFTMVGDRIVTDLRKQLFQSIVAQEIGFFDETETGELTSRLNSDTQVLQSTVTSYLSMALRFSTQAIGCVIVLFITSYKLASVMILVVPAVVFFAVYFGRKVRKLSRIVVDRLADSTIVAEESLSGIRTVRGFAREYRERGRYNTAVEASFNAARKRALVSALFSGAVSFSGYATIAIILWYGAVLVMDDAMSMGDLTSFILYTFMVAVSLGTLSSLYADFMRATGSAERVFELIDRVPKLKNIGVTKALTIDGRVGFDDVTFAYPTRLELNALQSASFNILPGEKVAFVGPSGSGKSTVASLLMRFYDPSEGVIRIDGIDIREVDQDELRNQIGIVAQEPILFSGTIADNVRYGDLDASPEEIETALRVANAWDFIAEFPEGLGTLIGERGVRLSGGQKQRVAIARAVLKDPAVLILDEATSALDVESESLVQEALERLMENRTTLIIAHRLSTVANADRVVVLEKGRVAEQGTHAELIKTEGTYHRLIERQRLLGAAS